MLYLLAGRREDALQPIPGAPPAEQEFWTKQLYGLGLWLDTQRNPDPARRAGEAKQALGDALARLGEPHRFWCGISPSARRCRATA